MNRKCGHGRRLVFLIAVFLCLSWFLATAKDLEIKNHKSYSKWLADDVGWIITTQERADFEKLTTDEQRDQFIIAFWERRNPTPGAPENKFKMEHYRRIAYSNVHFAYETKKQETVPGWKTARGHIYIVYGPPDTIDSHSAGKYELASGARASTDPFEIWHYKLIEGIGSNVSVRFVDKCRCGGYRQNDGFENDPNPRGSPEN